MPRIRGRGRGTWAWAWSVSWPWAGNVGVDVVDLPLQRNDFRTKKTRPLHAAADTGCMLNFKKLDVYQCSIQLLALTADVLEALAKSKGNAVIADQLKRARSRSP